MSDIKARMAKAHMTQVDMILELQKRGVVVQPPMLEQANRIAEHFVPSRLAKRFH